VNPGDVIDYLGGFTVYDLIEKASVAKDQNLVPMGISVGGVIQKLVKMGEAIRNDEIVLREDDLIVKLRHEQDKMILS
jgi:predicted homoserine dehydrogenase-like protein